LMPRGKRINISTSFRPDAVIAWMILGMKRPAGVYTPACGAVRSSPKEVTTMSRSWNEWVKSGRPP
jgi:hypothetical protein